jgi:hypothetical protein
MVASAVDHKGQVTTKLVVLVLVDPMALAKANLLDQEMETLLGAEPVRDPASLTDAAMVNQARVMDRAATGLARAGRKDQE